MRTTHGETRVRLAAWLALALGLVGEVPAAGAAQEAAHAGDPVLSIRVYADSGVDQTTVGGAQQSAQRLLDAAGLTTHWRVCDRSAACEPLSQRRLAERFGCDPSNISVLVDRLVERELVERRPDPSDGRVKLIAATPEGRALAERCCADREWLSAALDRLDAGQRDALQDALALLL